MQEKYNVVVSDFSSVYDDPNYDHSKDTIDLRAAVEDNHPELDFVWPGFLVETVGALVSPGATGKSFWALEAAMAVASGGLLNPLNLLSIKKTGRVVYFAAEDPKTVIDRRVQSIVRWIKRDDNNHNTLDSEKRKNTAEGLRRMYENLKIQPIVGKRLNIMSPQPSAGLIKFCQGARLIIVDTLSRFHFYEENKNGEMAMLVSQFEKIAAQTGAAILYLHHVSKSSSKEGENDQQHAARGASALIDNARWGAFVAKMTKSEATELLDHRNSDTYKSPEPIGDKRHFFMRFGINKQNYDNTEMESWYHREDGGVLRCVTPYIRLKPISPKRQKMEDGLGV